jgi:hypothetical protein
MDKLQWFKFTPSDWMMGKIQRTSETTQARFLRLCCLYWNKETNLLTEDAIIEIDKEHFDILVSKKIILNDGAHIQIEFLDEQMDEILETSRKCSKAGKASAAKREAKRQQALKDGLTPVERNPTDKIREEKKRKDLLTPTEWKDVTMRVNKLSEEEFAKQLDKFYTKADFTRDIEDIKSHFGNWLPKQDYKRVEPIVEHWNVNRQK